MLRRGNFVFYLNFSFKSNGAGMLKIKRSKLFVGMSQNIYLFFIVQMTFVQMMFVQTKLVQTHNLDLNKNDLSYKRN